MVSPSRTLFAGLLICTLACAQSPQREPIVGGPCEGCEAVFEGLPTSLSSFTRIAPPDEPGERLIIDGTVRDSTGNPVAGVIVYAYHTDDRGIYPRPEKPIGSASARHGRLRGWAKSDAHGRYTFDTIRPAGYPDTSIPAHVHLHVIEPGRCTYYIDDLHFDDDHRLTAAERQRDGNRGGSGLVKSTRDTDGTWRATRDIVLGKNIPNYPASTASKPNPGLPASPSDVTSSSPRAPNISTGLTASRANR